MFFFQDLFRASCGNTTKAVFFFNAANGLMGFLISLFTTNFTVPVTWFALIMAALSALNSLLFSYFSLKVLEKINLSLFSLFSMLVGMTDLFGVEDGASVSAVTMNNVRGDMTLDEENIQKFLGLFK